MGVLARKAVANSSVLSHRVCKASGTVIAGGISVLYFYANVGEAVETTRVMLNE
jgi:hypothetical protein